MAGTYGGYQIYEKDQRNALIHERQQELQSRIDALRSDMQTPTNDLAEIEHRKERLSELQKELDNLRKDVSPQSGN